MPSWLGRYLVKRAAWVVLTTLVVLLLSVVGVRAGVGPVVPAGGVPAAVPCVAPDDPPGCDPLETPAPTATPTPAPTATPTPTPTPIPSPMTVELSTVDRAAISDLSVIVTYGVGLLVFFATAATVAVGLRR